MMAYIRQAAEIKKHKKDIQKRHTKRHTKKETDE